jgi:hypothetical protein
MIKAKEFLCWQHYMFLMTKISSASVINLKSLFLTYQVLNERKATNWNLWDILFLNIFSGS